MPAQTEQQVTTAVLRLASDHPHMALVRGGKLIYDRHNDDVVYYKAAMVPGETRDVYVGPDIRFWYRAMTGADYRYLVEYRQLDLDSLSYGGIACRYSYVFEYFRKAKNIETHLVEFYTPTSVSLYDELMAINLNANQLINFQQGIINGIPQPKVEGGGTFGLGPTGFKNGAAGRHFNAMLRRGEIHFRLVALRLRNPFSDEPQFEYAG